MATRRKLIRSSSSINKLGDSEDLLVEILIRLPGPRSAFRCRSVCKRWNSLISGPYFPRRFVSHHRTLSAGNPTADESELRVLTVSQLRELILSFVPFPRELQSKFIVLDCNRDLLLLGFREQENDQELRRTYLVCNPFTKQWVALPLVHKLSTRSRRWIVRLVCEPFNSDDQVLSCRFRVVRMYTPARAATSQAEVYMFCSRSGQWKRSVLRFDGDLRCSKYYRVVSADGKLYWLNPRKRVVKWDSFNLDHGTRPTLLDVPEYQYGISYGPWVSRGALYIIRMGMATVSHVYVSVWRLEEEEGGGKGWRKQNQVRFSKCGKFPDGRQMSDFSFESVIGLHLEKSEIVFLSVFRIGCQQKAILSWDLKKNELELLTYQDKLYHRDEHMFQPRVTLWPSSIPNPKKLRRNTYDGSYNCWLPPSSESTS